MKYYFHVAENSGVGYYREYLPAVTLRETKTAEVMINDFRWGIGDHVAPTERVFFEVCNWADVIIVGRLDRPEYYAKWGAAREFFNVPVIMDTDDVVHHVRPSNPGYQGYHPGSEAIHWNEQALKAFDAITVSTNFLKDFYIKKNPRIHVLPNSLDLKEWDPKNRKPHEGIRMGFICSGAHSEGFGIILDSVYKIMQKYPQVEFYYPDAYWRLFAKAPEEIKSRLKNIPWIKLQDWPKALTELSLDIGLAPLKDNYFNRGKSNLRYIEYSAAEMASIVSPVEPYKIVKNGVDGIIAKERQEWYNGMEKLILDEGFRKKIARNARERVEKEFDIVKNVKMWDNVYKEIHEKYHAFYGKKKEFVSWEKGKYRELKPYY